MYGIILDDYLHPLLAFVVCSLILFSREGEEYSFVDKIIARFVVFFCRSLQR